MGSDSIWDYERAGPETVIYGRESYNCWRLIGWFIAYSVVRNSTEEDMDGQIKSRPRPLLRKLCHRIHMDRSNFPPPNIAYKIRNVLYLRNF